MPTHESTLGVKCLPPDELLDLAHSVSMFEGIAEGAIMRFLNETSVLKLQRGDTLIENGTPATTAFLVVDGEIEVAAITNDLPVLLGVRHRGDLVGEMALLTNSRRNATLRARTDACLLAIEGHHLSAWLRQQPTAILNILRTAVSRMKSAEADMIQHQHLSALGTLAAGLAHELNNPAAALLRGASRLGEAVTAWEQAAWELGATVDGNGSTDPFARLRTSLESTNTPQGHLDPIIRGNREQDIQRWLAGQDVSSPWELAPVLVERGWTSETLRTAVQNVPGDRVAQGLRWLAEGARVQDLLRELRLSAQVISDLVSAVKSYSRLDEAPIQLVDLHEGIEQSLMILRYQLRGINIDRHYVEDLPRITAYATELNQVWTNLIDNAAAVMNGSGTLTITTSRDDESVIVDVEDTGPGIPADIQDRVFEPFFTTKPPGQGTGLGLAISYSTVRKHGGTISVYSRPGRTRFRVTLPMKGQDRL